MTVWDNLSNELDAWAATGKTAEFWWRDDDAIDATPALDRLLSLRRDLDVPLALAVIPANARPMLAASLRGESDIDILQHGYAHINHRPDGEKKAELRADRELWDIARELAEGRGCMIRLFGDDGWQGVMVPPWNRIDPSFLPHLAKSGFRGLSTFKPRQQLSAAPGVSQINTHVDLMFWRPNPIFRGPSACVADICTHLAAKRSGHADNTEPTGVLSHHNVMNIEAWDFLADLFAATKNHPSCHWVIPAL